MLYIQQLLGKPSLYMTCRVFELIQTEHLVKSSPPSWIKLFNAAEFVGQPVSFVTADRCSANGGGGVKSSQYTFDRHSKGNFLVII